jgi:hypothetical protein
VLFGFGCLMLLSRAWGSAARFKVGCVSTAVTAALSRGLYRHADGSNWVASACLVATCLLATGVVANRLAAWSEGTSGKRH